MDIHRLVENECLRVASIFGADELNNRELLIDVQYQDLFKEDYTCLGRDIPVDFADMSSHKKPCRLVRKEHI